jgi:hypothetical protein
MSITVTNRSELLSVLSTLRGGETVSLAPGSYGALNISNLAAASTITFTSADPTRPAKLDMVVATNSKNLAFSDLAVGSDRGSDPAWASYASFQVSRSQSVSLTRLKVGSSDDGNYQNDRPGISILNSQGVSVTDSEIANASSGILGNDSSGLVIARNSIQKILLDGAQFGNIQGITLSGNRFTNFFKEPYAHADAIQFFTSGTSTPSRDIRIENNVITQGIGNGTQGIFLKDEVGWLPYENVSIINNFLYNNDSDWNGVTIQGARNVDIRSNTILSPNNNEKSYWLRLEGVEAGSISSNLYDRAMLAGNGPLSFQGNVEIGSNSDFLQHLPNLNLGATLDPLSLIVPGVGYQPTSTTSPAPAPVSTPTPAPAPAPAPTPAPAINEVNGTAASEKIVGSPYADRLSGVGAYDANPGRGSIDTLFGDGGKDLFILGDKRGAFYNDGNKWTAGRGDYAQVLDFQPGLDKIQLAGAASDYVFKAGALNGLNGLQILLDVNHNGRVDSRDELIGHIANVASPSVDYFVFG